MCVSVCIYIYVYICIWMYIDIYTYMYMCMYTSANMNNIRINTNKLASALTCRVRASERVGEKKQAHT